MYFPNNNYRNFQTSCLTAEWTVRGISGGGGGGGGGGAQGAQADP